MSNKAKGNGLGTDTVEEQWPGIDSRYRLIIVAALRSKQLQRGALPRIVADPLKRRTTSIALEEVKQGLVPFTATDEDTKANAPGIDIESSEGN
ncbi:MAG: DNA-directed RNA polymerase subunit omega [Pyrinomonadaceae bacterium]|nr:DNA-directed RNA polymerase subunit omega [Pyrinomonadaceae bacterium]